MKTTAIEVIGRTLEWIGRWWDEKENAGWKTLWTGLGFAVAISVCFSAVPGWPKLPLTSVVAMLGVAEVRRQLRIRRKVQDQLSKGISFETWTGASPRALQVLGILATSAEINRHLFQAGLYAADVSRSLRQSVPSSPLLDLYRSRARSGRYTVAGTHYLVPIVRRVDRSAIGPVVFFSAVPGATEKMYRSGEAALMTSMRVDEVRIEQRREDIAEGVIRATFVTDDPFAEPVPSSYFDSYVATSPFLLPIALTELGQPFNLPLHHTLIVGATGSGKGSVLQAIIRRVAEREDITMWGGDPKRAELRGYESTGFFREVAYDAQAIANMLNRIVEEILRPRQQKSKRGFVLDQQPIHLIVLDEFSSLLRDPAFKDGARALLTLLSQGRSDGIYVVAASQEPQKAVLDSYRQHFANRLALRLEQATDVDMVLGAGALEAGARPHLIHPANEANRYATAGICYVRVDGAVVKIRITHTSDRDILELQNRHRLPD